MSNEGWATNTDPVKITGIIRSHFSTATLTSPAASLMCVAPHFCPYTWCLPPFAAAKAAHRNEVLSFRLHGYWEIVPHLNFGHKILQLITCLQNLLINQCYILKVIILEHNWCSMYFISYSELHSKKHGSWAKAILQQKFHDISYINTSQNNLFFAPQFSFSNFPKLFPSVQLWCLFSKPCIFTPYCPRKHPWEKISPSFVHHTGPLWKSYRTW